jgi:hypothetical protein
MRISKSSDSFEFYLYQYVEIDKDGHFLLMRHDDSNGKGIYFAGVINNSIRKEIDSTFLNKYYEQNYFPKEALIYDGLDYCLDFKVRDSNRLVFFIPNYAPTQIIKLANLLDTLIYSKQNQQIDSFNLDKYDKKLMELSYPNPPRLEKAKVSIRH